MEIPTPKELLEKLYEFELIEPIVNEITEEICDQLYIKFHTSTLRTISSLNVDATTYSKKSSDEIRIRKDAITENIVSTFLQKNWLLTRCVITVNNVSGSDSSGNEDAIEINFCAVCTPKSQVL